MVTRNMNRRLEKIEASLRNTGDKKATNSTTMERQPSKTIPEVERYARDIMKQFGPKGVEVAERHLTRWIANEWQAERAAQKRNIARWCEVVLRCYALEKDAL